MRVEDPYRVVIVCLDGELRPRLGYKKEGKSENRKIGRVERRYLTQGEMDKGRRKVEMERSWRWMRGGGDEDADRRVGSTSRRVLCCL